MPKFSVSRTQHIDASPEKVYKTLSNFHTWPLWSPWLMSEPAAKVDVKPDGRSYTWEGKRVGSGGMSIDSETENRAIDFDLQFFKPWKSQAKTGFILKQNGTGTDVTWSMDSSLPFFMFFMKKMMVAMIGSDYERGLNLLKDYVEDGEVHSKLNFIGEKSYDGCTYVGIKRAIDIKDSGTAMGKDFASLAELASKLDGVSIEKAFCIYHKWDFVKGKGIYTAAFPVDNLPTDLSSDFVTGSIPACKIHALQHVGPYHHLGNAWTTMYTMIRNKEFKASKKYHPFETYDNNPQTTPPNELKTTINFVLR